MARKPYRQTFKYQCTITEEEFVTTKKAEHPEELISINAFYELNPDQDDRPTAIKKEFGILEEEE